MAVVINTNYSATVASNNLASSNAMLQKSLNRLSSGSKIVSPADDAGGLAVSMKLGAASRRQGAALANIGNATSYLQTQDGALKVAGKVLDRISELKTLYVDPTKNTSDQANYDSEFTALQAQLTALTSEKFNGVALFGSAGTPALSVSVTEDGSTSSAVALNNRELSNTSSGVGALTVAGSTANSLGATAITLTAITTAIQNVATMRANNGAEQSRLGFASELLTTNKANLEAATSRILDVDVASESTQLARWNTLVQAGTSMLVQANGSAQTALKLLQ
ncbi:MAG: flagellin [Verrucomicrobia bacterium]|nr:flagellin [Verrucomicrobiota bacterium]